MSEQELEEQISGIVSKLSLIPEDNRQEYINAHMHIYRDILGSTEKEVERGLRKLFLLIDTSRRLN